MAKRHAFIPVARKIAKSEVWEMGPEALQLWMWLLLEARFEPGEIEIHEARTTIERGQLWTTTERICKALRRRRGRGYDDPGARTIERLLRRFRDAGMIETRYQRWGMLVTIMKFDEYNPLPTSSKTKAEATDFPQWAHALVDEWDDNAPNGLPPQANRLSCVQVVHDLHRIDKHPEAVIAAVVRYIIAEKTQYCHGPAKLRKPIKDGSMSTFEYYRRALADKRRMEAQGPAQEASYKRRGPTNWRDE